MRPREAPLATVASASGSSSRVATRSISSVMSSDASAIAAHTFARMSFPASTESIPRSATLRVMNG